MLNIVKRILNLIPFKRQILVAAALLPPLCKGKLTLRIFQYLHRVCDGAASVDLTTNLGISRAYRIVLKKSAHAVYLFGTAEQYVGERGGLYLCKTLFRHCSGFLDIGAHHGYYTFFLRDGKQDGTPIYFFEPEPSLFSQLQNNCRENGLKNVFGSNKALGNVSGTTTFYLNRTDLYSSSLSRLFEDIHEVEATTVDSTRFDEVVQMHNLNNLCVKVDVEAAEFEFLEGAKREADKISFLIMEVLEPAISHGFINTAKAQLKMEAYYINDFRLEYCPDGAFSYVSPQYNWLFCRHKPDALQNILRKTQFTIVK